MSSPVSGAVDPTMYCEVTELALDLGSPALALGNSGQGDAILQLPPLYSGDQNVRGVLM